MLEGAPRGPRGPPTHSQGMGVGLDEITLINTNCGLFVFRELCFVLNKHCIAAPVGDSSTANVTGRWAAPTRRCPDPRAADPRSDPSRLPVFCRIVREGHTDFSSSRLDRP